MQVIDEARIVGDFEGYDRGKVFRLSNGQRWRQVASQDNYRYMQEPKVRIFKADGGHFLEVEGADLDPVEVERVK